MKRKNWMGIAGLSALALSVLMGPVVKSQIEIAKTEALQIYVDKPTFISEPIERAIDNTVKEKYDSDMVSFEHPEASRVAYTVNLRRTRFTNLSRELIAYVDERKIGNDEWKFKSLNFTSTTTPNDVHTLRNKIPWVFQAAEGKTYTVKGVRNQRGKITKLVYSLPDGSVTLEDRNGNGIADKILFSD